MQADLQQLADFAAHSPGGATHQQQFVLQCMQIDEAASSRAERLGVLDITQASS